MFSLTEKCFPLTNFPNSKQTQESLKNNFLKTTFQKTNIVLVIEYFPLEIFNGYFPITVMIGNYKRNMLPH
jgi:hypothetical protein